MEWYIAVWKNYAVFSERARRNEYWFFVLFNFLISLGIGIVDGLVAGITGLGTSSIGLLGGIYLAVLMTGLAVAIRRLHRTKWLVAIN